MTDYDLTICSVYYSRLNRALLETNMRLTKKLNPNVKIRWVIVNNSPSGAKLKDFVHKDIKMLPEIKMKDVNFAVGSHHHGRAINSQLPHVKTRFALILDCDLYIIRENWASDVLEYIQENNLSFFGVPYHPIWYRKYRYFPCAQCLFIDLKKVDKKLLDFEPGFKKLVSQVPNSTKSTHIYKLITKLQRSNIPQISKTLDQLLPKLRVIYRNFLIFCYRITLHDRRSIGVSHDTGYKVFKRFHNSPKYLAHITTPVFQSNNQITIPPYNFTLINRIHEFFLKESQCFIPKRKDYYTSRSFKDFGYPDVSKFSYEENIWQGKPFSFHVKGMKNSDLKQNTERIKLSLQKILNIYGI